MREDSGSLTGSAWQGDFPRHPKKGSWESEVGQGYVLGLVGKRTRNDQEDEDRKGWIDNKQVDR